MEPCDLTKWSLGRQEHLVPGARCEANQCAIRVLSSDFLLEHSVLSVLGLTPKGNPSCHFVSVPPTPLPTNDVDVYFETSADDNEHARFQKAKEQLEIRHRNRMDRVNLGTSLMLLVCGVR